jgi:aminoglycoside phosphotransferase family enzyme/predicted kinase
MVALLAAARVPDLHRTSPDAAKPGAIADLRPMGGHGRVRELIIGGSHCTCPATRSANADRPLSRAAGDRALSARTTLEAEHALVDALSQGSAYGLPDAEVERVTTHAAVIFLVGERAYKMKRAVRYSFLDFSTSAKRRRALEAEFELNRRTAPMLYHRLVGVHRTQDGRFALEGRGHPVEWLLEMRRFDQRDLLDRIAGRGELAAATIDALAQEIAEFHEQAERHSDQGGYAGQRQVIEGNAEDLGSLAGRIFGVQGVEELKRRTESELERRRDLLEERRHAGFVRHCHGDLHLGNIVLLEGRPVLFDCLEFDPALATIDTFYDLAFLLMDLCHRDLRPEAQRLLNGYLDACWDDRGVALLPLFLSVRGAIRAKVQGFAADLEKDPAKRASDIKAAHAYLDLARRFLQPEPARLVAIGGISGTGKSTLARALAPGLGRAPGAVLLRTDVIRKKLCGVAPIDRLGADAYRESVSRRVYETLMARAGALLAAGQAVIVDAVFLDPADRAHVEEVARERGVPFDGLWLSAPPSVLAERVEARRGDASDATRPVVEAQLKVDPGTVTWRPLDASGEPKGIAAAARTALGLTR